MSTDGHATARMWELDALAAAIRTDTVQTLEHAGHEHRGTPTPAPPSPSSILITALYFDVMRLDPAAPALAGSAIGFVLSKGHGCMALLRRAGAAGASSIRGTSSHVSPRRQHPPGSSPDMRKTPGVDMTSGSLGHGLSAGVGLALDARARGSASRTFVLLGDGELQEASSGKAPWRRRGTRSTRWWRSSTATDCRAAGTSTTSCRSSRSRTSGARSAGRSKPPTDTTWLRSSRPCAASRIERPPHRRARPHHQGQGCALHGGRQPLAPGDARLR